MRFVRPLIVSLTILGFTTSSFAGDLQNSIAKAVEQPQPATTPPQMAKPWLISGAVVFGTGMAMALYGFLHTNGGEFVQSGVSKTSNTALGATGLAVAAAGGAILFVGAKRGKSAAAITVTPDGVVVSKRVSW